MRRRHADELHWSKNTPEVVGAMRRVLDRIRADGPLQARDFEGGPQSGDFWGYSKIERRALHELFMRGDVMVAGRTGFTKIFDLPQRCLPAGLDLSLFRRHCLGGGFRQTGLWKRRRGDRAQFWS